MTDHRPAEDRLHYIAIGNNELGDEIGESVTCPRCSGEHPVLYGERVLPDGSREPSRTLGFYRCGDKSYLCAVEGRSVMEKFR